MSYAYNGKCDDILNTEDCDWDNGDCCKPNVVYGECEDCTCKENPAKTIIIRKEFSIHRKFRE